MRRSVRERSLTPFPFFCGAFFLTATPFGCDDYALIWRAAVLERAFP
jgi:hypothetical protein